MAPKDSLLLQHILAILGAFPIVRSQQNEIDMICRVFPRATFIKVLI